MNEYFTQIKESPLLFKIKRFTPEVFHRWHQCAQKLYPTVSPEEQEEKLLFSDMLDAFSGALEQVTSNQHVKKRRRPEWTHGYVCGFVQGNLQVAWYNRYVLSHIEEYKEVLLLKSLLELFKIDPQTWEKLWAVYQYVSRDFVLEHYGIRQSLPEDELSNVVRLVDYDPGNQRAVAELWQWTEQQWEKELKQKYLRLLSQKQRGGVPDLTEYVNEEEVKGLLGKKP